eukprot:1040615-Rhodomonas_salina.1
MFDFCWRTHAAQAAASKADAQKPAKMGQAKVPSRKEELPKPKSKKLSDMGSEEAFIASWGSHFKNMSKQARSTPAKPGKKSVRETKAQAAGATSSKSGEVSEAGTCSGSGDDGLEGIEKFEDFEPPPPPRTKTKAVNSRPAGVKGAFFRAVREGCLFPMMAKQRLVKGVPKETEVAREAELLGALEKMEAILAVPGVEPSAGTSRPRLRTGGDGGAGQESRRPRPAVVQGGKGYKYAKRSMYASGTKRALLGFDQAGLCNDCFNDRVCKENRAMGMECEDGSCSNKALQMRAFIKTEVRRCATKGKGLGLFAVEQGCTGDAVEEMVGYVLSGETAMTLVNAMAPDGPNYICRLP